MSQLHAAGVVHGDLQVQLYVSNIAWRLLSGKVDIKILDWDTAFLIHDHAPPAQVPLRLKDVWQSTSKWKGRFGKTGRVQELDRFMIRAMQWGVHDKDPHAQGWKLWLDVAKSTSAGEANVSFRALQARYLSECFHTELAEEP